MGIVKLLKHFRAERAALIVESYKRTEIYRYACFINWYEETTGWGWKS